MDLKGEEMDEKNIHKLRCELYNDDYEYDIPAEVSVLSLFDGMSCGMIAMLNAGMAVKSYDAYEIDKYAIKTASHNFPLIRQHGDVFSADFSGYEGVDYVIGGSPCTYWSIAQKNNRETEASGMGWKLFQQYVRAVREAKPKYFIYENNKSMSSAIRCSISEAFGFDPICINSALVSAQNRHRLYWVGRRNADGTYSKVDVEQPEDRGILLRDILETEWVTDRNKSRAVLSSIGRTTTREYSDRAPNTMVYYPLSKVIPINTAVDGKGRTLKAQYYKNGIANFIANGGFAATAVAEPIRIGTIESGVKNKSHDSKQYRVYSPDGKSTTLCGQGGGVGAKMGLYAVPINGKVKEFPIYKVKDGLITIKDKQYPIKLTDGFYVIRKLTVSECKRLQTVPEWYDFSVVSNSQAYKMLGNGWTCDVISHLIRATRRSAT